jgi:hypothetical protein
MTTAHPADSRRFLIANAVIDCVPFPHVPDCMLSMAGKFRNDRRASDHERQPRKSEPARHIRLRADPAAMQPDL